MIRVDVGCCPRGKKPRVTHPLMYRSIVDRLVFAIFWTRSHTVQDMFLALVQE